MIKKRVKFYENDSLLTLVLSLIYVTYLLIVVPLGIEPRLFCTKNRRVASYTMGHFRLRIYFLFSILPNFLLNYSFSFEH